MNPYTKGYFEDAQGSHYKGYKDWPQFKQRAEWIKKTYNPKSVYELGAAKGFLLKHLKALGIDAFGCDISEYATQQAAVPVTLVDVATTSLNLAKYDLVVSFDFLEHIKEDDLNTVFTNLKSAKNQFHMITTSEYDFGGDDTHFTSKPRGWWVEKFEENGIKKYKIIHAGEQEIFE